MGIKTDFRRFWGHQEVKYGWTYPSMRAKDLTVAELDEIPVPLKCLDSFHASFNGHSLEHYRTSAGVQTHIARLRKSLDAIDPNIADFVKEFLSAHHSEN